MPTRFCCVCGSKAPKVSLHCFPKDNQTSNLWKERCGVRLIDDASRFFVCSNHFTADDFVEPNAKHFGGRMILKHGRLPHVKVFNPITTAKPAAFSTCTSLAVASKSSSLEASTSTSLAVASTSASPDDSESAATEPIIQPGTPKRKFEEPRYAGEIVSPDFASPKRARRAWHVAKDHIQKQKKKISVLQQKNRRLVKKIASMSELVKHLQEKNTLSEDAADTLINVVPVGVQQLIARKLIAKKRATYSPQLRSFALSLQFHSSKAYNYVRNTWDNLLPHPSTLRAWYSEIDGEPGFSEEAFQTIRDAKSVAGTRTTDLTIS